MCNTCVRAHACVNVCVLWVCRWCAVVQAAGVTPLAAACVAGNTELVRCLLAAGASRAELHDGTLKVALPRARCHCCGWVIHATPTCHAHTHARAHDTSTPHTPLPPNESGAHHVASHGPATQLSSSRSVPLSLRPGVACAVCHSTHIQPVHVHPRVAAMFQRSDSQRKRLEVLRLLLLCNHRRATPVLPPTAATTPPRAAKQRAQHSAAAAKPTPSSSHCGSSSSSSSPGQAAVVAGAHAQLAAVVSATPTTPAAGDAASPARVPSKGGAASPAAAALARHVAATLTDACVGVATASAGSPPHRTTTRGGTRDATHSSSTGGAYHHMFGESHAPAAREATRGGPSGAGAGDTGAGAGAGAGSGGEPGTGAAQQGGSGSRQVATGADHHDVAAQVSVELVTQALAAVSVRASAQAAAGGPDESGAAARGPSAPCTQGWQQRGTAAGVGSPATLSLWLLATRVLGACGPSHEPCDGARAGGGGAAPTHTSAEARASTWAVPASGHASLVRQVLRFL